MASERQKLEEAALPLMLDAMWAANVMDIQQTLRAVCQDVRTPACCWQQPSGLDLSCSILHGDLWLVAGILSCPEGYCSGVTCTDLCALASGSFLRRYGSLTPLPLPSRPGCVGMAATYTAKGLTAKEDMCLWT